MSGQKYRSLPQFCQARPLGLGLLAGVESPEFRRSHDALGTELVPGNRCSPAGGGAISPRRLEAIASARSSISMEMYIFATTKRIGETFSRLFSANS